MYVKDRYKVSFGGRTVGHYYVYSNGSCSYTVYGMLPEELAEELAKLKLGKDLRQKRPIAAFSKFMTDENSVPGTRRIVFESGPVRFERIPEETGEKFWIYRRSAGKGEAGYSEKDYSAPHYEGPHTPEGMREWCSWYCFNRMDDGTFEVELDEAWWWGGSHNDGGTIRTAVPEEWFALPYPEFLENAVGLSAAAHYGFTPEELAEKPGLREFFGF